MNVPAYPGQGLSLSQLVFALNAELKRVAYSSSFTFDVVSQLDQDASTALANIREWRNSFVTINRFPPEVLSLIPTHLSGEEDVIHASRVCRHWRRTLIQHAALWTNLDLSINKTSFFVETRLERAKGMPLAITCTHLNRPDILTLFSLNAQRLGSLDFIYDCLSYVQKFSEAISGPLPLLHTLKIHVMAEYDSLEEEARTPNSAQFFAGAVNLEHFSLHTEVQPFLDCFTFPNLTTFELTAVPEDELFPVSQLFDFLEATPTLQDVRLRIREEASFEDIPPDRVIVLPNVEGLSVAQEEADYTVAARLSCPSIKRVSLTQEQRPGDANTREAFPASAIWDKIPPQFMGDQFDEVILESKTYLDLSCSLHFLSHRSITLEVGYGINDPDEVGDEVRLPLAGEYVEVLSRAAQSLRSHPLLATVKTLTIRDSRVPVDQNQLRRVAGAIGELFRSLGPLKSLTLAAPDLRPYLAPFVGFPNFQDLKQTYKYPQIKDLWIVNSERPLGIGSRGAIVEFAESQHALGIPFERVMFRCKERPTGMMERLEPWVGLTDFLELVNPEPDQIFV